MPEIGSSGLMSGDGKRGDGHWPQATAPILDSTWLCENAYTAKTLRRHNPRKYAALHGTAFLQNIVGCDHAGGPALGQVS
jgi:hypothetical protein